MKYLGKKNIIYAVIAIASVAVCAIVANAYQNGNIFVPSGTDRGLNANQVSFSGDGDVHDNGDDDKSGESELWDKDDNAEDTQKPKNADDADYLFRNDAQLPYKSNDRTLISNGLSSGLSGNMISGNSDSIYSIVYDKSGADIVINSGSAINGNKKDENMSNGSNSEYSDEGGNDGSSDTVNNGTQGGSSGSNNSGSSSGKDNFSENPVNPEKHNYADTAKDPDPDNSSESGPAYSENITKPAGNPDDNGDYNSVVIDKPSKSDDKSLLYKGQSVTKKIIYAALDKFVLDENLELYEFGSDAYDKYMRIVGISFDAGETWITEFPVTIPEQIEEGMMFIRTEYRISTKSDTWVKRDVSYDPESVRIFLLSQKLKEENATINESDIINMGSFKYPEPGDTVNLYRYISDMLGDSDERLTQLFPGWMENGEIVPFNYKAVSGRHILEPADMTALDDDYEVELSYKWMDDDGNIDIQGNNLVYLQTLKNYYKSDSVYALAREWITGRSELLSLKVPKYIQAIDMYEDAGIAVGYIEIPSTVIYINNSNGGFSVRNGYIVDEENQYYCSKNGVLYNKAETEVLGIPYGMAEIRIPKTVKKINVDKYNSISDIIFDAKTAENLPEIMYDNISDCRIIVNKEVFDSFLTENYEYLTDETGNTLVKSSEPDISYHVRNGLLINNNGECTAILENYSSSLTLPGNIKSVESGVFAQGTEITRLILNDDVTPDFKAGCFDGSEISEIFCHTEAQYSSVVKQLKAMDVSNIDISFVNKSKEGFTYIIKDDGEGSKVVLISVPDNLTEFDGTVTAGDGSSVAVYEINESAFKGCSELKWVTLPESVKCIGSNAFKNCSKLEGILIDSKDDIRIENRAFDNCESLRFIASNAMHANVADGYTPYITDRYKNASESSKFFLALPDADGYEAFANQMAGSTGVEKYVMQDAGSDAKILYAATSNGIPWVALRAAKELPDEVVLPESVTEIYDSAFADTTAASGSGSFTIKNWANENIWSIGSLAFRSSELTGDIIISSENSNYNVRIDSCAFAYSGITSIDVKGDVNALGESIFEYCKNLKNVSIDQMTDSAANKVSLCSGSFTGCENFTNLTFNCIPNLAIYGVIPFRFNDDIDADVEAESIRIHLPAGTEEQCVRKLRYLFAGYSALTYDNAYLQMRDFIKFSNIDWETFELPSEEDVDALLSDELLCAENRIRTMIGLETVSEPVNLYQYYTDSDGIVTLTSVPSDAENITLTCEQMEMPDGWYVSCIAANAFSKCKDLKSVTIPEKLSSIESGAFAGMESSNLTLKLMDTEAPVLQNISVDEPFTFGIDADRLSIEVPDGCIDSYISSWAFPLAGYTSFSDMFSTIYDETERELNGGKNGYEEDMSDDSDDQEAVQSQTSDEKIKTIAYERMAELLMPAENTLRTIFGKEQITDTDGLICLKNHQATELIDIDDENDITSDDNVTDMNDDENDDEETECVIENDDPLKNDGQLTLETDENQEEEKAE